MKAPGIQEGRLRALVAHLRAPVDGTSVALMRMAFGALMVWECWRYWSYGWIHRYFVDPARYFTYDGFHWLRPWPGEGMVWHFAVLALSAAGMAAGAAWRVSSAVFALAFAMVFLIDRTNYLNHFYLITLLGFVWCAIPAHRTAAVDARLRPGTATGTVPRWALWLLRFMIGVPYVFGGIAKLNADWLHGEPVRLWLADRADWPVAGPLLQHEGAVWFFAGGGLLLDLFIVPALVWKRTRKAAFVCALLFHGMNSQLFQIGVFPWLMIAATTIFFEPDWPRRLIRGLTPVREVPVPPAGPAAHAGLATVGLFVLCQVVLPFRHHLYPGNVSWTEEGHRFSWHMKLRDKRTTAQFRARDPRTGRTWLVMPEDYLTPRQVEKFRDQPDMLKQFAGFVADDYRLKTGRDLEIYASVSCSLNGRPPRPLVDPSVDLVKAPWGWAPSPWILPLDTPLARR